MNLVLLHTFLIINYMVQTPEIIKQLKKFKLESASRYGINLMGIFGSYARGQQDENSDQDIFISLNEADFFVLEKIKEELENVLHIPIDIVNFRSLLRNTLKQNNLKDAVYI